MGEDRNTQATHVLLIRPGDCDPVEVIEERNQDVAKAFCDEYNSTPGSLIAIVWPPWADLPSMSNVTPN
jgi:hypothetical protein